MKPQIMINYFSFTQRRENKSKQEARLWLPKEFSLSFLSRIWYWGKIGKPIVLDAFQNMGDTFVVPNVSFLFYLRNGEWGFGGEHQYFSQVLFYIFHYHFTTSYLQTILIYLKGNQKHLSNYLLLQKLRLCCWVCVLNKNIKHSFY